jgi:hypothetical protein
MSGFIFLSEILMIFDFLFFLQMENFCGLLCDMSDSTRNFKVDYSFLPNFCIGVKKRFPLLLICARISHGF